MSKPSSKAAVTVAHLGPGEGMTARRPRSTPSWLAATNPMSGAPTTAHQEPAAHGPFSKASAKEVIPGEVPRPITTVLPRRSPFSGKRPANGATSGSRRSWAKTAPLELVTAELPKAPLSRGTSRSRPIPAA